MRIELTTRGPASPRVGVYARHKGFLVQGANRRGRADDQR